MNSLNNSGTVAVVLVRASDITITQADSVVADIETNYPLISCIVVNGDSNSNNAWVRIMLGSPVLYSCEEHGYLKEIGRKALANAR